MVKVRGKKVDLQPSEFVLKDLVGPKGRKGALNKKPNKKTKVLTKKGARKLLLAQEEEAALKKKQDGEVILPESRGSEEVVEPVMKGRWSNKQRLLVFGSRGISFRGRHVMDNFRRLLPHTKKESKMDKRDKLFAINEISEMKNCNKTLFFEGRQRGDIYLWMSNIPDGPSFKFLMENVATMEELKFTGNCLKGSRAILSFDPTFDSEPHYQLMKEMLTQTFGTPYHHPKSQPFIDHVFTFSILDQRVWFRNYQIMEEDGSLVEIGPRFCLNPIRIFEASFSGATIWENSHYVSPNKYRSMVKKASAGKYVNKVSQKIRYDESKPETEFVYKMDPTDEIFHVQPEED